MELIERPAGPDAVAERRQPVLHFPRRAVATRGAIYKSGRAAARCADAGFSAAAIVSADVDQRLDISTDRTKLELMGGTRGGQVGIFFIDPNDHDARATPDDRRADAGPPSSTSYQIDEGFTQITYLWRVTRRIDARLNTLDISCRLRARRPPYCRRISNSRNEPTGQMVWPPW